MKKFIVGVLIVCIVLSNSLNAHAMNSFNFCVRTQASCQADVSTTVGNALNSTVFPDMDSGYNGQGHDYVEQIIGALNTFDVSLLSDYDYYVISCNWSSGSGMSESWRLNVTAFSSSLSPFVLTRDYNGSHYAINIYGEHASLLGKQWYCSFNASEFGYGGGWSSASDISFSDNSGAQNNYGYSSSIGYYCLDANFPVISSKEADDLRGDVALVSWLTGGGFTSCTDIFDGVYGYDASGNLVPGGEPDVVEEDNSNHMYFENCEMGFCIPDGMTNFTTFGGAYAYIRYQVDDWVVNHIADYKIVVSQTAVVGDRQNSGSVTLPLDPDGCIVIPFSSFMSGQNAIQKNGFTTCVTNRLIDQNYYKTYLYSIASSDADAFVRKQNSPANTNSIYELWKLLKNGVIGYLIAYNQTDDLTVGLNGVASQLLPIVFHKFDPYNIRMQVKLIDDQGNESGTVAHLFNLVTGSQDTVDTSGLENHDPFEPGDDDYIPVVPGDNSTYPQLIIYSGGEWTGTMDAQISYDPGYQALKSDINSDPDGNFTQYLNPIESNDGTNWFMSYVNGMPVQIKGLLITGVGVGVLFGLYRFIRRG